MKIKAFIETKKSAKDFLLFLAPEAFALFDVPKTIIGIDTNTFVRQKIYAMSEETAQRKIEKMKELLNQW